MYARILQSSLFVVVFALLVAAVVFAFSGTAENAALRSTRLFASELGERMTAFIAADLSNLRYFCEREEVLSWLSAASEADDQQIPSEDMRRYFHNIGERVLHVGFPSNQAILSLPPPDATGSVSATVSRIDSLSEANHSAAWFVDSLSTALDYSLSITPAVDFGPAAIPLGPSSSASTSQEASMLSISADATNQLWLSYKVVTPDTSSSNIRSSGELLGVVAIPLSYNDAYARIFADHNTVAAQAVSSYLIDQDGRVCMDSSAERIGNMYYPQYAYDMHADPMVESIIRAYLSIYKGSQNQSMPERTTTAKLSQGYNYMAIAPVANSNWSAVSFYNSPPLLTLPRVTLLTIVAALAFLCLLGLGLAINSRLVFGPLQRLSLSIANAVSPSDVIYGAERNDEIGAMAKSVQSFTNRLGAHTRDIEQFSEEQERLQDLLFEVNTAANMLLSTVDEEAFIASLHEGMHHIAQGANIDRIIIWHNEYVDDKLCYRLLFRWTSDIGYLPNAVEPGSIFTYRDNNPEWEVRFLNDEAIHGPLSDLSPYDQGVLDGLGIQSFCAIPVSPGGTFWGYVTFDDCHSERNFTDEEISILRSASLMLVSAVNRNAQAALLRQVDERARLMLDATPLCCFLWDRSRNLIACNNEAVKLFGLQDKQEFLDRFEDLSPKHQPDESNSTETMHANLQQGFRDGFLSFNWVHCLLDGTPIPCEITLVRVHYGDDYAIASYARDLRENIRMMQEIEYRDGLLHTVNDAAMVLLEAGGMELDQNLYRSLQMMGLSVNVDRVTIWKNYASEDGNYCDLQQQWPRDDFPGDTQQSRLLYDRDLPY
ncbi:MAG: PAS domain-containing protein, partial [Symbiobacteriaceae bacterium]|nr:PAS domain-containing protein [Symbiobacteriaceae bacterium]